MEQNLFFFLKNKKQARYLYDNLSLAEGIGLMRAHGFTAVPVIGRDGTYSGSVSEGDFLRYLVDHPETDLQGVYVHEIIRKDYIPPVSFDVSMETLLEKSLGQNYVPVVDDRNVFIGIVTRQSILEWLIGKLTRP